MQMSVSWLWAIVRHLSPLCVLATMALISAQAAEEDRVADWERQGAEAQKALRAVTGKLIALAEDTYAPKEERWRAVVGLGRVGTRDGLEFLVDHISLRLLPPHWRQMGGDEAKDWPCLWTLRNLPVGWERDGRNWNLAQIILRALAKPRTNDELSDYAELLRLALGSSRFSDQTFAESSRALALVEVELVNEAKASRYVEPEQVIKDRATRVKNLTALKNLLEKEWGKGRDGK
jgi:hypothetical protein